MHKCQNSAKHPPFPPPVRRMKLDLFQYTSKTNFRIRNLRKSDFNRKFLKNKMKQQNVGFPERSLQNYFLEIYLKFMRSQVLKDDSIFVLYMVPTLMISNKFFFWAKTSSFCLLFILFSRLEENGVFLSEKCGNLVNFRGIVFLCLIIPMQRFDLSFLTVIEVQTAEYYIE